MAEVLLEKVQNISGKSWIRAHGAGVEKNAFRSSEINPDAEGITLTNGHISCPDCIAVIECCKGIPEAELDPEYRNDLFNRRLEK